jgi:ATP-dependent helicase HrpB
VINWSTSQLVNWSTPILPITGSLDDIRTALSNAGAVVVHAPPGAGKTTIVPPALLDETWLGSNRIVMLEPRRLAARAAAQRMAALRNEPVGRTIGYRTRIDTRVSADTRIEVVTEGVLTRMLQNDPTLDGYGLVIFDEFHERSLQGDTGLALTLHTRQLVRPDLRVAVMSATLDGTAVARLLDNAPIATSLGREFSVETRHRAPPRASRSVLGFDPAFVVGAIRAALHDAPEGDVLVFLPGAPEINRVERLLAEEHLRDVIVIPLHGSLQPGQQDRAIAPADPGTRKVVLATSIAETSLTIDGVRVVIDSGLARRSRFSPRTGMSRLETLRVSRAAADQRRGRAGRTAPGICYRLWSEEEDSTLQAFAPPEIMEGDLAPLALDLAVAGVNAGELSWIDPPPQAAFSQATELLRQLEAIDDRGRATPHGQAMAKFGMHPRLAHMILRASAQGLGQLACDIAAIVGERDPLRGLRDTVGTDLRTRVDALRRPRDFPGADVGAVKRAVEQSRRSLSRLSRKQDEAAHEPDAVGRVLALAYPERVAKRRPGPLPRYLLRNGTGARLPEGDGLGQSAFIVIAESDGKAPESRVWLSAPLEAADLEADFGGQVVDQQDVEWSAEGVRAWSVRRLGAIELSRVPLRDPDPEIVAEAVSDAIRRQGLDVLRWSESAQKLRQRLCFLHAHDPGWPDVSDAALTDALLTGLHDALGRLRTGTELRNLDVTGALLALLDWGQRKRLEDLAPTHFEAPTGSRLPIDYSDPRSPKVSVRLQEMFGTAETPTMLGGRVALTLYLLSPAHRPVQVTRDLAGFWRTSYYDVRKDMRARYPKHSWPDDPLAAAPTRRARRRE